MGENLGSFSLFRADVSSSLETSVESWNATPIGSIGKRKLHNP